MFDFMNAVLVTFAVLFLFMACAAYLRFGPTHEEFGTFPSAIRTQFTLMLSLSIPAISKDPFLTLYIVSFVLLCTLAMLNFFLAIVVNGYTNTQEEIQTMEAKTARGVLVDIWGVILDAWAWRANNWPSKIFILNSLLEKYPRVFRFGYAEADPSDAYGVITREEFVAGIIELQERNLSKGLRRSLLPSRLQGKMSAASLTNSSTGEISRKAGEVFDRLYQMKILRPISTAEEDAGEYNHGIGDGSAFVHSECRGSSSFSNL